VSNPIREVVDGSPIQVGTRVRILASDDPTFDQTCAGLDGTVTYLEYECGCGQTFPNDPMIGVLLHDGRVEEFWIEELAITGSS